MQIRLLSWLFLCASLVAFVARAQTPASAVGTAMPPGLVLVAKVTGEVTMTAPGLAAPVRLEKDRQVPQNARIVTAQNASVVLVYSNGATTQLGPDTDFVMEEFLQEPFGSTIKVADLEAEPTPSRTKLMLNKGELIGNVKKLKTPNSFSVNTPVGAAGIRGTTFRIVFRPAGTGQAFGGQVTQNFQFQLTTLEGEVGFTQGTAGGPGTGNNNTGATQQGSTQNQQGGQGQGQGGQGGGTTTGTTTTTTSGTSVPEGQQITITLNATVNAQGQVTFSAPPTIASTAPIDPSLANALQAVAREAITATANATFTAPSSAGGSGGSGGTAGQGTSGQSQGQGGEGGTNQNSSGTSGGGTGGTTGTTGTTGSGTTGTTGTTGSSGNTGSTGNPGNSGSNNPPGQSGNSNPGNPNSSSFTNNNNNPPKNTSSPPPVSQLPPTSP